MMLFNKAILTAALVYSASAFAVEKRQTDPALAPLAQIPPACESTCAILTGLASIDPNNLATLSAVCTPQISQSFTACITCFETNSPQTFTPALVTALQSSVDQLGTGCLLIGSPVSSIIVPQPTGVTPSGSGSASGGSATPTPSSSSVSAPAASTTSRSGATEVTASRAGLLAAFSVIGATFFL